MMFMKISSIMNKAGFTERGTVTGVFGRCSHGRPPSLWQLLECRNAVEAFAEELVSGEKPMPQVLLTVNRSY